MRDAEAVSCRVCCFCCGLNILKSIHLEGVLLWRGCDRCSLAKESNQFCLRHLHLKCKMATKCLFNVAEWGSKKDVRLDGSDTRWFNELWRIHVSSHLIALWKYQVNGELLKDHPKLIKCFQLGFTPSLSRQLHRHLVSKEYGELESAQREAGGLGSDTSNLSPLLCPSCCSSSSVTAQCRCAMALEAAVSEVWDGKGKEIAVKLPGIATVRVLQNACEKSRQVFRWIQELFAKSMGLMFPRLSC